MTQTNDPVLGYSLQKALEKLAARDVSPSVRVSTAPGRVEGDGELRVVWQNADGSELIACAFQTRVGEDRR